MLNFKFVAAASLTLSAWLTTNHFSPWVSWHAEVPIFVLALLAAGRVVMSRTGGASLVIAPASALPLLLCVVVVLQYATGLVPWRGQALMALLYGFLAVSFMQWGWLEAQRSPPSAGGLSNPGEWLAWILIAGGLVSVAIALAQVLDVWESASFITRQNQLRRPGGNLGQANHLATLLVMAMGAVLFLSLKRKLVAFTSGLTLLVFVLGVSLTESRTGLLSSLGLCVLWAWKRPEGRYGLPRSFAALMGGTVVTLFLTWPALYPTLTGGQTSGETAAERIGASSADPRLVLWQQVFESTLLKPVIGWGFRNTAEAHNAISHSDVSTLPITYSHNLVLDLAVWFGWPVALAAVAVLFIWGSRRFFVIQKEPLAWFGFALVLPFGIHCMLEFPFAYAYLLMPALLGVGWIEGSICPDLATMRIRKRWLVPPVLVLAALALWSAVDYLRVEEDFRVARFQMLRIGPPPETPPPQILLLDQLGDMVASTRVPLSPGLNRAQMDLLRKAAVHNPWSGSQYRYATALALNGQPEEARRQMQVLRAQHGFRVYRVLAEQLEKDLATRGWPALELSLEKPR